MSTFIGLGLFICVVFAVFEAGVSNKEVAQRDFNKYKKDMRDLKEVLVDEINKKVS